VKNLSQGKQEEYMNKKLNTNLIQH
jgi:hypothetical protein